MQFGLGFFNTKKVNSNLIKLHVDVTIEKKRLMNIGKIIWAKEIYLKIL